MHWTISHASQHLPDVILRRSFTRPSTTLAVIEGLGTRLPGLGMRLIVSNIKYGVCVCVYIGSELLAVAVATPVGIALCLLVLVLVVIAVVLVWRQQHRRRGQYEYNQMKFSEVNED